MIVDYLQASKDIIENTHGTHGVEEVKSWALIAIAYALIHIAENMKRR